MIWPSSPVCEAIVIYTLPSPIKANFVLPEKGAVFTEVCYDGVSQEQATPWAPGSSWVCGCHASHATHMPVLSHGTPMGLFRLGHSWQHTAHRGLQKS